MDDERGHGLPRRTTTDLDDALDGTGAVLTAIRVGGNAGRVVDETVPLALGVLGQETVGPGGIAFALRTLPVMRDARTACRGQRTGRLVPQFHEPGRSGDRGVAGPPRRPGHRHLRLPHLARTGRRRCAWPSIERPGARLRGVEPPRLVDGGSGGRPGSAPRAVGERTRQGRGGGAPLRRRPRSRAGHDPQRVPRVLRAGGCHRADDARTRRITWATGGGAADRVLRRTVRRTLRCSRRLATCARRAPPHVHGRGRRRPGDDRGRYRRRTTEHRTKATGPSRWGSCVRSRPTPRSGSS